MRLNKLSQHKNHDFSEMREYFVGQAFDRLFAAQLAMQPVNSGRQ